jgi:HK97 family phage major capsid protein
MKLTKALQKWAYVNCEDIDSDSDEKSIKSAIATALVEGELSSDDFKEMSLTQEDRDSMEFKSLLTDLADTVRSLKNTGVPDGVDLLDEDDDGMDGEDEEVKPAKKPAKKSVTAPVGVKGGAPAAPTRFEKMLSSTQGARLGYDDEDTVEKSIEIRVKEAADSYSTTKSAMHFPTEPGRTGKMHPLAGQRVVDGATQRPLDNPSDLDKAVAGAWAKFIVNSAKLRSKNLALGQLQQHDKELIFYAMENMAWGGASDGGDFADIKGVKLTGLQQKALIDDATSGGIEAAPIVFDDQIIETPLLYGELYPLVNVKPLDRGRRVEGVVAGTVTASWGGVDDAEITLFDTTSYVSAFDTTVFRWEGAVRIGLDFLSDSPIDFGQILTRQYGERLLEDLDDVVATGNGSTQPEGVANKTGAASVSFGGTTSIGSYESLRFGVGKAEHRADLQKSAVWIGTETSYQRARAIPVGASDARRLGGMDYSSYRWMERDYKINQSLTNSQIIYAILARYRMYRRRGLTIRTSTEGDTLIRRNEMLMVATARYGGQMERGACIARTSNAPA